MLALRDAEDWARLELRDEVLATRIREVHESLSDDVLNGVAYEHSARWKARLWDRYAFWRGHDPNEGAARVVQSHRLRQRYDLARSSAPHTPDGQR